MGSCFSCRRRRPRSPRDQDHSSDREPLLRSTPYARVPGPSSDPLPPPKTLLEKAADVIAALNAGKLPAQDQVNAALRALLRSGVLDVEPEGVSGPRTGAGQGEWDEAGTRLVQCAREVCQALLQFGMEKNDDDRVQDLLFQLRQISSSPVHVDVVVHSAGPSRTDTVPAGMIAGEIPSKQEGAEDAGALLRSVYELAYVLATSAAFRLILSDIMLIARETAADVAARVGEAAAVVQTVAGGVEETVRPGGGTLDDVKDVTDRVGYDVMGEGPVAGLVAEAKDRLQQKGPDEVKATVVRRLQEAMVRAHQDPSFQAALRTILSLFRKYAAKLRTATTAAASAPEAPTLEFTPVAWADPPLANALTDFRVLAERAASGRPLDALLQALGAVVVDAVELPAGAIPDSEGKAALRNWFATLGFWLDSALADPAYAASDSGRERAGALYDQARELLDGARGSSGAEWARHVRALLDEVDGFVAALARDRTTRRLVDATSALGAALTDAGAAALENAPGIARARAMEARRDAMRRAVLWLVPRVLRAVGAIPMPRVEYVDDRIEMAVDALLLTAPRGSGRGEASDVQVSLVPDRVRVESWNEFAMEVDNAVPAGPTHSAAGLVTAIAGTRAHRGHEGGDTEIRTRMETQMRTRARVHLEGVRLAAHDVAYYVRYKGVRCWGVRVPCTAYEDEGLVSVEVGAEAGTGLSVDVELEFDAGSESGAQSWMAWLVPTSRGGDEDNADRRNERPLFRVADVRVDLPGLDVRLTRTRHWVLNALVVQPLAGPVARAAVAWVLGRQVRDALEAAARFGGRVQARAQERAGKEPVREAGRAGPGGAAVGVEEWWEALAEEVGLAGTSTWEDSESAGGEGGGWEEECGGDGDDAEDAPLIEVQTRATAQGVIRRTVTHPPSNAEAATEESILAIGVGAQVLPGKGGPYGVTHPPSRALEGGLEGLETRGVEEARGAVEDIARAEGRVEEEVRVGLESLRSAREGLQEAGARAQVRTRVEGRRKDGWRSRVFDLSPELG